MNRLLNRVGTGVAVLTFVTLASACSLAQKNPSDSALVPDYDLIAENLLDVLATDDRMHYTQTTFQVIQPKTPIGQALFDQLSQKGYGVQLVSGDVGDNFIRFSVEASQSDQGDREFYSLAVRNIVIERQYALVDGKTVPMSVVTLKTDAPEPVSVDDGLFDADIASELSQVTVVDVSAPEVVVVNRTEVVAGSGFDNTPSAPTPMLNVHDIQQSNFASVFKRYNNVSQVTLIFPNDSLTLGEDNNSILRSLARKINPETDIVSIIGCSHGNTALKNGNQLLAEGRTQRVTESLMFAGVEPDLIMDEACWAAEYWDEAAPRRGVMVTHKRLKTEG